MRGKDGSVLLWLIISLLLITVLGIVAITLSQGDGRESGREAAKSPVPQDDGQKGFEGPAQTEEKVPEGAQSQKEEQKEPLPPMEEGGPQGNDRSLEVVVSPPVDSGQEAFAAVVERQPEARDWFWSVEQPRYQVWDRGDRFLVRLYALLPAEGALPERSSVFGDYFVFKADAAVSKAP